MRIDVHEHFFHRDFARLMRVDDFAQVAQDELEPRRQLALRVADAAAGDVTQLSAGGDDDAEACHAQARVDAEDAAYDQPLRAERGCR